MATALRRFALARPRHIAASNTFRSQRAPVLSAYRARANPFAFGGRNVLAFYSTDSKNDEKDAEKAKDDEQEDDGVEVVIDNDLAAVGEGDNAPTYPHVLAMPALRRPFFPGVVLPMTITNPEVTRALMALKESGQKYVGVFLKKSSGDPLKPGGGEDLVKNLSEIHHVGSFARIDNMLPFDVNSVQVLMVSQRRIAIDDIRDEGPPLRVNISLAIYIVLQTPFTGSKSSRHIAADDDWATQSSPAENFAHFFYLFATFEVVLQSSRYFIEKGQLQGSGILSTVAGILPEPYAGYARTVGRYSVIYSTVVSDAMVVVFVLGATSWWKGGAVA